MAIQATVYWLWNERNKRHHQHIFRTTDSLIEVIDKQIRNRIQSFRSSNPRACSAMMQLWLVNSWFSTSTSSIASMKTMMIPNTSTRPGPLSLIGPPLNSYTLINYKVAKSTATQNRRLDNQETTFGIFYYFSFFSSEKEKLTNRGPPRVVRPVNSNELRHESVLMQEVYGAHKPKKTNIIIFFLLKNIAKDSY